MKQANREKLQEEAHSKNTALGTALLRTATSRGVSSHTLLDDVHPTCACTQKRDAALLAKIKCLRKDLHSKGNDLMGHLTLKKCENRNSDTCGAKKINRGIKDSIISLAAGAVISNQAG